MTSPDSGRELTLADQRRAFARLIAPFYEEEWRREVASPKPRWSYLTFLHQRMTELEQECR